MGFSYSLVDHYSTVFFLSEQPLEEDIFMCWSDEIVPKWHKIFNINLFCCCSCDFSQQVKSIIDDFRVFLSWTYDKEGYENIDHVDCQFIKCLQSIVADGKQYFDVNLRLSILLNTLKTFLLEGIEDAAFLYLLKKTSEKS